MAERARSRIGFLSVYFGLFDKAMPPEFRSDREKHAQTSSAVLGRFGDVYTPHIVDSEESGRTAGRALADTGVDLVVCAPSMAAPPSYLWAALEELPAVPVVAVGAQESDVVPEDYETEQATRRSLPVGLVMLTNVLVRNRRAFLTVFGVLGDETFTARLGEAVAAAAAANRVRGMRLLSVGEPIGGYLDVMASSHDLARLGVAIEGVSARRLADAYAAVDDGDVVREIAEARAAFDGSNVTDAVLGRSARLACALRRLCDETGVAGGAVNCHGDVLRWNPDIGITACLGVSRLTEEGRPFACTGDLPTAIALVLGKAIGGAALYCELYQLDLADDWLLVANGGEGDLSIRDRDRPVRLLPEDHYSGICGPGAAVAFSLSPGPATLISLTPVDSADGGWRLVVAEGDIVGSKHEAMEGPNGMFRFSDHDVVSGFTRWCEAGATHHAALLPGHHVRALTSAGRLLEIDVMVV